MLNTHADTENFCEDTAMQLILQALGILYILQVWQET